MSTPKKPAPAKQQDVEWVSVDLTAKQIADMKSRFPDADGLLHMLQGVIEGGYKITLSWDNRNECYSAYIIPVRPDSPNTGSILSSRGGSVFSALRGVSYRHLVIFDGIWGDRRSVVVDDD